MVVVFVYLPCEFALLGILVFFVVYWFRFLGVWFAPGLVWLSLVCGFVLLCLLFPYLGGWLGVVLVGFF